MTRFLPLLLAGAISFWNYGSLPATFGINASPPSITLQADERANYYSSSTSSELTLTDGDQVRAWTTLGGVEFEAIPPSTTWKLPVDQNTGLLLAAQVESVVTFNLLGTTIVGKLRSQSSAAFFLNQIMTRQPLLGTLSITSDQPIAVWATECQQTCIASPVQSLP